MQGLFNQNILVLHPDQKYYETFVQEVTEAGGFCVGTSSLEGAKKLQSEYSFDLIVCFHTLEDGGAEDILDLFDDEQFDKPRIIPIGHPIGCEKIFNRIFGVVLDEFRPISSFMEIIQTQLQRFSTTEFKKHINTNSLEFALYYDQKQLPVEMVEYGDNYFVLDTPECIPLSMECTLRISMFEKGDFVNYLFICQLKEGDAEGRLFEVSPSHIESWKNYLKKMAKKQTSLGDFLKRATGA